MKRVSVVSELQDGCCMFLSLFGGVCLFEEISEQRLFEEEKQFLV